jgi:hypothetical protein
LNEQFGQVLVLNNVKYPLVSFSSDKIRPLRVGQIQTGGPVRWDEYMGAYRFKITDFSGPLGQPTVNMESDRQGHRLYASFNASLDGSMGYLTGPPRCVNRITPSPSIPTIKTAVPSSVATISPIRQWDFYEHESAPSVVTTTNYTLSDPGKTVTPWSTNQWVGFVVTCNAKTMVIASNTASVLNGAGWSGGGNPGNGNPYEIHARFKDAAGNPRIYIGVGNEVWSSCQGLPVFQASGTADGSVTVTDTTLRDTRPTDWATDQWIGFTVTCQNKTLLVTSNTGSSDTPSNTLTGSWVPNTPGDSAAWEMHLSLGAMTGATMITNILSVMGFRGESSASGYVPYQQKLLIVGAGPGVNLKHYYSNDGWSMREAPVGTALGEYQPYIENLMAMGGIRSSYAVAVSHGGTVWFGTPSAAAGIQSWDQQGSFGSPVHFLSSCAEDVANFGLWLICQGSLRNMSVASPGKTGAATQVGEKIAPVSPSLTCGCLWQRRPTVSDGGNIWPIQGDTTTWIGLPPQMNHPQQAPGRRYWIQSLNAAGHLLIAGVREFDGTNYAVNFLAYDEQSQHWRVLWRDGDMTTAEPVILGAYLANMREPPDPNYKYLFLSYAYGGNSYVYTLHMPRSFVGVSNSGDEFGVTVDAITTSHCLPTFEGGDPSHDGTLLRIVLETELFDADACHRVNLWIITDQTSPTQALAINGLADGVGRMSKTYTPTGGLTFTHLETIFLVGQHTYTAHPYIHSIEYFWRKRGDAAREYVFDINADVWRDQGKTYADLWTYLEAAYQTEGLLLMSVTSEEGLATIVSSRRVSVSAVEAQPVDPRRPKTIRVTCEELI